MVDQATQQSKDQAGKQSTDKSQDQVKHKITVDGQELELTVDELKGHAQQGMDYTKKTQDLADRERSLKAKEEDLKEVKAIVDETKADPKLGKVLNKVYSEYKSGKFSKSEEAKDRGLKKIDKLIDEAEDPKTREGLRDMREIIREEAPGGDIAMLQEQVEALTKEIGTLKSVTKVNQADRISKGIESLESDFGKDIVAKHKNAIEDMALKYPTSPLITIFKLVAPDNEYEAAVLNRAKLREKKEIERKRDGAGPGGEPSTAGDIKPEKDRFGRVNIGDHIRNVLRNKNIIP